MRAALIIVLHGLVAVINAQQPYLPPAFPPTPILPSSINYAPSVTPTIQDPTAPVAQQVCPGYIAQNVQQTDNSITADLTLAGQACNAYGNDIPNLVLTVQYQTQQRLSVRIQPKYLSASNQSLYILSSRLTPQPGVEGGGSATTSDLSFVWTNSPTFQFQVTRRTSGDVLFSTYGTKIVFEDQFLELVTSMVPNYNIYGLAESLRGFRLPNYNFTQTFWNAYNLDNDQILDVNGHSVHPMYLETRYGSGTSQSHGVYGRNAHGQDWVLAPDSITYRAIGGSFDFYFLSGPTAKQVISQYQVGIVKTPFVPPYWTLGFLQCRWGYQNWTNLQEIVDGYAAANIQLEAIMSDLDYLKMNRDFTLNPGHYDQAEGQAFLARLHANGQYWLPILDPNVYAPNPANASDAYATYDRGVALQAYVHTSTGDIYYGDQWPGFSAFPDFLVPQAQQFWTTEIQQYHSQIAFDGFWLDVSDASVFCTGSCGSGMLGMNPIHVPFALPGDPDTMLAVDYRYPEGFEVTNATEAASATSAMMSQSAMYPTPPVTPTPVVARTLPTPGVRNLTFPPYAINNFLPGHSLVKEVISPDALHLDGPYNSTEYELHNLYGHLSANATYNALVTTYGGNTRPFFMARSTFAGSGAFAGHWGGDTNAKYGDMYFGISQALTFSIVGIPYFGVETCGFNGNTDMQLCTRWMQLSAWFPMYRNHNNRNTIPQEAYRWSTTAESTRIIMNIRYSLLPYTYTLFHLANTAGETVLRALAWEFPEDPSLAAVETQFMSGPAILVTPVLAPLATTVQGVFPGVANGTIWYDWYTLQKVSVAAGENKTLTAPLTYQPIHVRGGYIVPLQQAGNTTKTSRRNPWSLILALDKNSAAQGQLYLDDGVSIVQQATKNVQLEYSNSTLQTTVMGSYVDGLALSNITIAGAQCQPSSVSLTLGGQQQDTSGVQLRYSSGTLYISNLDTATSSGVWSGDMIVSLGSCVASSSATASASTSASKATSKPVSTVVSATSSVGWNTWTSPAISTWRTYTTAAASGWTTWHTRR